MRTQREAQREDLARIPHRVQSHFHHTLTGGTQSLPVPALPTSVPNTHQRTSTGLAQRRTGHCPGSQTSRPSQESHEGRHHDCMPARKALILPRRFLHLCARNTRPCAACVALGDPVEGRLGAQRGFQAKQAGVRWVSRGPSALNAS